jgi:putative MFS transporter
VVCLVGLLLSTTAGMIAMLSPYSTEQYPTALRATGSGVAAAASKVGGLAGPLLLGVAPVLGTMALIVAVPLVAATAVLFVTGLETAGQPLLEHRPDDALARTS